MKKLSLEKTWTECLRMWKWITKHLPEDTFWGIEDAKDNWLEENGYMLRADRPHCGCFFCEYKQHFAIDGHCPCSHCPAKLVDKKFDCQNSTYSYDQNPKKFYAELLRLNKMRLKKKAKK